MEKKNIFLNEICQEECPSIYKDRRGRFVKVFQKKEFLSRGWPSSFEEEYYSVSKKNVLRGLHFQLPPMDHEKIVYCPLGKVIDVVVDLRKKSDTFGQYQIFDLSAEKGNMIYIPKGFAHGFYTLSDEAIMMYKVTSLYSREHDSGILWSSLGIPWPTTSPILSERDQSFLRLADFDSPF
jgi:dTDP-4-dehydrorhamnose 3,5-epimerase